MMPDIVICEAEQAKARRLTFEVGSDRQTVEQREWPELVLDRRDVHIIVDLSCKSVTGIMPCDM